jgi:hypothetical protein
MENLERNDNNNWQSCESIYVGIGVPSTSRVLAKSMRPLPTFDAFLSPLAHDKAIGDAACAALEQVGLRCWMAPRAIVPGQEWSASIVEGIERSNVLVLLHSTHANASRQILREVERAVA